MGRSADRRAARARAAPSGDFTNAVLHFVDELERRWPDHIITVLLPELFVEHWWGHLLHNQSALILKGRLLFRRNTAVTSIPYRVEAPSGDLVPR